MDRYHLTLLVGGIGLFAANQQGSRLHGAMGYSLLVLRHELPLPATGAVTPAGAASDSS